MMVLFDHEEQAGLLQTNFQQLITTIEQSMNMIWPPEEASVNQAQISQVGTVNFLQDGHLWDRL